MLMIMLLTWSVSLGGSSEPLLLEDQPYRIVLEHLRAAEPGRPIVLYDRPLRLECLRGGCPEEPFSDVIPDTVLERYRTSGLVVATCSDRQGLCVDTKDDPVLMPEAAYVTLTTSRPCGENCIEIYATVFRTVEVKYGVREYYAFRLLSSGGVWCLESANKAGEAYIDT